MAERSVPQPSAERIVSFAGHPIVVGVVPGQAELVLLTALNLARGLGVTLYCAYADPTRTTVEELPDGSVGHVEISPDVVDEGWRERDADLRAEIGPLADAYGVAWEFRYLAGRPDRALTHLARAVDAAAFVVGASGRGRTRDFFDPTTAAHLSHHQHRPVLTVPLTVVDWRDRLPWQ